MTNDSSTGGYIQPIAGLPVPLEDAALDTFLQQVVVNLTGLSGKLVFPRWQPAPPNWPSNTTNWSSVGISEYDSGNNYEGHNPTLINPPPGFVAPLNGYDITIEQQDIELLVSFYGPNARSNASLMRSNINVAQNREFLVNNGFGLKSIGRIVAFPELINQAWYFRVDMPVYFKREIIRYYPIRDIASVQVTLENDMGLSEEINIEQ